MHSGVEEEAKLDIRPPPQSKGIHFEATFSEPMMIESSYTAGPSSQPSFTELPHTEIPSQAPHAPDHAPWMDLSAHLGLVWRSSPLSVILDSIS